MGRHTIESPNERRLASEEQEAAHMFSRRIAMAVPIAMLVSALTAAPAAAAKPIRPPGPPPSPPVVERAAAHTGRAGRVGPQGRRGPGLPRRRRGRHQRARHAQVRRADGHGGPVPGLGRRVGHGQGMRGSAGIPRGRGARPDQGALLRSGRRPGHRELLVGDVRWPRTSSRRARSRAGWVPTSTAAPAHRRSPTASKPRRGALRADLPYGTGW